uniref:GIY-YIG domain-containing protein n=1 Tax=Entomoneis paludosa TaxID=265537 RepID=A0A7S2Y2V1_9STRA|mmetsp:Transcript_11385/g.23334  ORF Transcript_11385/g.23334 Transcript_11385/m.23334 type:complete len:300 (+) Transcript_11385:83-982(+)|eukprot:CAMPEP_0172456428 /NCGR_PEP_ID=MMETSP1065-20121228/15480_1 /TAXON_ID=265537 /ORGANISM="Amphiprora paludosa, Strain CCMP125" /LENGTH=299 /DNA_ID=CAMNT_0013209427 /DNA_START=26 /DNA_END=925 /DNA_ORIENTATION=-
MPRGRGGGGYARRSAAPRRTTSSTANASKRIAAASSSRGRASGTAKTVTSRQTTGLYTPGGKPVFNAAAYTQAGGRACNSQGRSIRHGVAYAAKVQQTSIQKAAKTVQKQNPRAQAFSYTLKASDGKHYAGYTAHPTQRMQQHLSGNGAVATQQMNLSRVTIHAHSSVQAAKKNETRLYYQAKEAHGIDKARGAGHTKKFSDSDGNDSGGSDSDGSDSGTSDGHDSDGNDSDSTTTDRNDSGNSDGYDSDSATERNDSGNSDGNDWDGSDSNSDVGSQLSDGSDSGNGDDATNTCGFPW